MTCPVVSGSKPGTSLSAPPFPAEIASINLGRELAAMVPSILSTSKQQNRESLVSETINMDKEAGTPVLLLSSQICFSFGRSENRQRSNHTYGL